MKRTHENLDLGRFRKPELPGNSGLVVRVAWYAINAILFQSRFPLLPSAAKAGLLRLFGATVGPHAVIKPRVSIKYPWYLELGKNVWLGEGVWIDNPGKVIVGSNVCISQGVYLVTGNHDSKSPGFDFFPQPIAIGARAWIRARAIIPPGSNIPANTIVAIGSVWRNSAPTTKSPSGPSGHWAVTS